MINLLAALKARVGDSMGITTAIVGFTPAITDHFVLSPLLRPDRVQHGLSLPHGQIHWGLSPVVMCCTKAASGGKTGKTGKTAEQ